MSDLPGPAAAVTEPDPGVTRPSRRRRVSPVGAAVVVLLALGVGSLAGRAARPAHVPAVRRSLPARRALPPRVVAMRPAVAVAPEYLATGTGYVDVLLLADDAGRIRGTVRSITASGQPPEESTVSETEPLVGVVEGRTLRVSYDGGRPVTGITSGPHLVLAVPQPDGTSARLVFQAATLSAFDAALNALDAAVRRVDQQAVSQTAAAPADAVAGSSAGAAPGATGAAAATVDAFAVAASAYAAGGCGTAPVAPSPLPPIS